MIRLKRTCAADSGMFMQWIMSFSEERFDFGRIEHMSATHILYSTVLDTTRCTCTLYCKYSCVYCNYSCKKLKNKLFENTDPFRTDQFCWAAGDCSCSVAAIAERSGSKAYFCGAECHTDFADESLRSSDRPGVATSVWRISRSGSRIGAYTNTRYGNGFFWIEIINIQYIHAYCTNINTHTRKVMYC